MGWFIDSRRNTRLSGLEAHRVNRDNLYGEMGFHRRSVVKVVIIIITVR